MFLVVGLGNPGKDYDRTRHNVGFEVVDALQAERGFAGWKTSGNAQVARGKVGEADTLLLKPVTYMNLSGEAVGGAMRFYKIPDSQLIVVHDELDFEPGVLKVKVGGGHGGNNGVKSIISHCGREFVRVRVGIGKPKGDGANWVLGRFDKRERELVESALQQAREAVLSVIEKGVQATMNVFNQTKPLE